MILVGNLQTWCIEVPIDEELDRVIPVIEQIRADSDICISIDTNKPEVMEAAVHAGANMINDVYALRSEGALAIAAKLKFLFVLMHMQGEPHNYARQSALSEWGITEVKRFFAERIA